MAEAKKQLHVAMFPWLAFGHMIPFLELGKLIAQKGHRISFISTPKNIDRLPKIPPDLAPSITLVKLPLPRVENLPENAEATMDVPHHLIPYLKIAHDALQDPLSSFLHTSPPDWIIHDFAPHWLPPIASKLGISRVFFSIYNSFTWCLLKPPPPSSSDAHDHDSITEPEQLTVPPKWVPFPTNISFRFFEANRIFDSFEDNPSGVSDSFRHERTSSGVEAVAFKTCVEVEAAWRENKDSSWDHTIGEWLDKQESGSVVYIALGSEIQLSPQDLTELALGLEQSGLPFFWALRFLEDKQAGVEVPRNELDGSFTAASVAQTLRLVVKDEEGKIYRDKAKEMITLFGDKDLHSKYIDKFVDFLENHHNTKGKD
ncbi:hypothetical protein FH972_004942 [Carpinus fangiana]|uniref:Uncharacterized protein n=1 Tax=Carpinus fangiana TaxID=176857 RepID=A0A5N6QPL2_9ROSI|nr:hypothetical protein FH972_004942 [Carpinus fangiana]